MSQPITIGHRDPFLYNKFLDANDLKNSKYDYRRPCIGATNFCDYEYFRRLNVEHPFRDAYFPRFPQADFLYQKPSFAVEQGEGKKRWGGDITRELSSWRTSFPDRQNRLANNTHDSTTGMGVLKPAPETLTHGKEDLSNKRMTKVERTRGGAGKYNFYGKRWDRFREGAPNVNANVFMSTAPKNVFGQANLRRSYSDGSLDRSDCTSSIFSSSNSGSKASSGHA